MDKQNVEKLKSFKKELKEIWAPPEEDKPRQEHKRFKKNGLTIIRRVKKARS